MRTTLLILLLAVTCIGQSGLRSPAFVGNLKPAGSSLLIDENFEGTGTPSGWASSVGTPNYDNTSAPLADAQDLKMADSADNNAYKVFTDSSEVWLQCEFKCSSLPTGSAQNTILIYNSAFSAAAALKLTTGGTLTAADTLDRVTTVDVLSAGTKYWMFFRVKKGTGANAEYEIAFSTTSTRPGSGNKWAQFTSGNLTITPGTLVTDRNNTGWGSGNTFQIDNVKISNTGWPP